MKQRQVLTHSGFCSFILFLKTRDFYCFGEISISWGNCVFWSHPCFDTSEDCLPAYNWNETLFYVVFECWQKKPLPVFSGATEVPRWARLNPTSEKDLSAPREDNALATYGVFKFTTYLRPTTLMEKFRDWHLNNKFQTHYGFSEGGL